MGVRFPHGSLECGLRIAEWKTGFEFRIPNSAFRIGNGDVAQPEEAAVSEAAQWRFDSSHHHSSHAGRRSAGSHKPGGWVRHPGVRLSTGYANRNSGQVESLTFVGSTPTPVTIRMRNAEFGMRY